ncbi:MAG: hypothetical protein IJ458_00755 [Clostridia bacterium]|nr:hypothetical protein [Clostridia bacterium]
MNKFGKILTTGALVAVAGVTFMGCNDKPKNEQPKTLWTADLSADGIFGVYGTVEKNDGSVTLKMPEGKNYAGSTYFGETDKNYDWVEGGLTVELKVNIDETNYSADDYSVWTLALNETDGKYITENTSFFVGYEDGVKFIYKAVGVDTDYDALAADSSAIDLASGSYTMRYDYDVNAQGEIVLTVSLLNANGNEIYKTANNAVEVIDHEGYVPGTAVKEEDVGGLRYLWLARTTVDGVVEGLKITE